MGEDVSGGRRYSVETYLLNEASLAYVSWRQGTRQSGSPSSSRYRHPRGRRIFQQLWSERKAFVIRPYQFLSGHEVIGSYFNERIHEPVRQQ